MTSPSNVATAARTGSRAIKRSGDRLLTLDRVLLSGIFAIGVWVATNNAVRDELVKKVEAGEQRSRDQAAMMAQLQIDNAVMRTRLEQIATDIARTTAAIEKISRQQ